MKAASARIRDTQKSQTSTQKAPAPGTTRRKKSNGSLLSMTQLKQKKRVAARKRMNVLMEKSKERQEKAKEIARSNAISIDFALNVVDGILSVDRAVRLFNQRKKP